MLLPLQDDNPTTRIPYVTYCLIAVNLAVMLWLSQLTPLDEHIAAVKHGFIPARVAQLSNPQLVVSVSIILEDREANVRFLRQQGQPAAIVNLDAVPSQIVLTALSCMFMHGGWLHLAGNMWFLWIFGNNVEDRLGPWLYLPFYLVGGLLATACHWAYQPSSIIPVIGASGAVAVTWPKAKVRTLLFLGILTIIEIPALAWLGLWFVGQLFDAVVVGKNLGVAVWAHIGGFVAGALLMPILAFGAPPPGSTWHDEIKRHFTFDPPDRR